MRSPEELPVATDEGADVFVCRRPQACESDALPCPYCLRIELGDKRAVEELVDTIGQLS